MRKTLTRMMVLVCLVLWLSNVAYAQQKMATPEEAKANVKKAVAYYKAVGKEKAFSEFNNPKGKFSNLKRGLYITVYDINGKCHASGAANVMVGKDFLEIKDMDGKPFIKEGIALVKSKDSAWIDYKWTNPVTKKIEKKTAYMVLVDGYYSIASGAYRR